MIRLALLLLLVAHPALALSCLRPDPIRDYISAAEAEDIWIVTTGVLKFDESRLPGQARSGQTATDDTDIPARVRGKALGDAGFTIPFNRTVTLRALCFGPWCGQPTSGTRYLMFLKRDASGYMAFANPCGGQMHANPSAQTLQQITTCFNGGPCKAQN